MSRRNFTELCQELTAADEDAFAAAWQRLGLSVDWDLSYRTIDRRAQAISQRVFLRDLARGDAYQAEGPALWDVTFGTAVAQAETEDREPARQLRPAGLRRRRRRTRAGDRGDDPARAAAGLRGAGRAPR